MAIWQHKLFLLPKEELESYFGNSAEPNINMTDFDNIDWWKYREINIEAFSVFSNVLKKEDSWSKNIIQYGNLDSTCIELILENSKIVEASTRIDLRKNNETFIKILMSFALNNDLVFLSCKKKLNIVYPNEHNIKEEIKESIVDYDTFLDFLDEEGNGNGSD